MGRTVCDEGSDQLNLPYTIATGDGNGIRNEGGGNINVKGSTKMIH